MSVQLAVESCRRRQDRLRERLAERGMEGALVIDPRHIHYLSGYWRVGRVLTPVALLILTEGRSTLVAPTPAEAPSAVDSIVSYDADRIATLIPDPYAAMFEALRPHLKSVRSLGTDGAPHPLPLEIAQTSSITPLLLQMRRFKDQDEVAMLEAGIVGCDAAYAWARDNLAAGMTEVRLYAGMLAAAIEAVGEPVTEFGNDFQCGALGSQPRCRPAEAGETAILDVGVVYRGYSSDLCRTFVAGGQPSAAQLAAQRRVLEALEYVEATVRPGVSCKTVYAEAHAMLEGFRGWTFPHHLGHGIGLSAHEAPRLNPHWEDTFEVGDVFTAEPGLYGDDLRAGIRIEQDYLVTPTGPRLLSPFPVRCLA